MSFKITPVRVLTFILGFLLGEVATMALLLAIDVKGDWREEGAKRLIEGSMQCEVINDNIKCEEVE